MLQQERVSDYPSLCAPTVEARDRKTEWAKNAGKRMSIGEKRVKSGIKLPPGGASNKGT